MSKIYYEKNKEKVLEKLKLKRLQNLDLYRENDKLKYEKNREKCLISMKKWKQNHKSEIKEYRNKYNFNYYHNILKKDPKQVLRKNIRNSINKMLKINLGRKTSSILNYLPYSLDELKYHIEKQFEPWMNWNNYGNFEYNRKKWHLDHIKPHSLFNYDSLEHQDFKECWALSNLQPLEVRENMSKGSEYNGVSVI